MKTVGIVSFFPAFIPPSSGGELRLTRIAERVAERFNVEMCSPTYGHVQPEAIEHTPRFIEHRFPKTKHYNGWHAFFDRTAHFSECSGLVCSLAAPQHRALRDAVHKMTERATIITHESPFLLPLAPRRRRADQLLVYNSYNVEAYLAQAMFGSSQWGRWATRRVRRMERHLVREADLVFVCSDDDAEGLVALYGADRSNMVVVPNGVDIETIVPPASPEDRAAARARLRFSERDRVCFFIGSYHPPNLEAAWFILNRLAPALTDVTFLIAGKVCEAFAGVDLPGNFRLLGLVSEETRRDLLAGVDVAVNPMFSGSGTNLKMLDYLAAGLPIVTTPFGARGLGLEHLRHSVLANELQFLRAIEDVLGDGSLRDRLRDEGRRHVEERFSWRRIGDRVAELYEHKISRRVLILNDYPVNPAESGGKIRVDAVARNLAENGTPVTVLTLKPDPPGRHFWVAPNYEELNIPKSPMHRRLDAVLSHGAGCSADDVSALLFTRTLTPEFERALRRELRHARAVLFSHCYLEPLRKVVPRNIPVFFDSHNVEWELKEALYARGSISRRMIHRVRRAEQRLTAVSRSVFCVSQKTLDAMVALVPQAERKCHVAPNGVHCDRVENLPREQRIALREAAGFGTAPMTVFLGSGHPPNAQAARIIIERIAPENPNILFLLIGSVCGWFVGQSLPENVLAMGIVSDGVKEFLLQTADLALNPMEVGSGTSLKLFDYLAAGLPVLTTQVGARGISDEDMPVLYFATVEEFSARTREILDDLPTLETHRAPSRELARRTFDWRVALRPMQVLRNL